LMRQGVVLGEGGGAMAQMIPTFKRFVGGPIGNGRQWFPWIHLEDLAAAVQFLLEKTGIRGPVNLCAPNPVRNRDLAAALGKALNRPAMIPAPAFVIRMVLGEFSEVLLGSQRTVPQKLLQQHFSFRYPDPPVCFQMIQGALSLAYISSSTCLSLNVSILAQNPSYRYPTNFCSLMSR